MSWLGRLLARGGSDHERPEPRGDALRLAQVAAVLLELEPLVAADGGRIDLLGVRGELVFVELRGACTNCSASDMTLDGVLEPRLRAALPWFAGLRVETTARFAARAPEVEERVHGQDAVGEPARRPDGGRTGPGGV